jgi:hypothetical protein
MSCRTTPAGSAFTSYARIANGSVLSDVATLSLFHYLRSLHQRRDAETRRAYTREQYDELLNRQRTRTERLTGISDARRQSLLARIDAALAADMPDQSTVYALFNLNPTVRERGSGLQVFLNEAKDKLSITLEEATRKFKEYEDSIDRSRSGADPETYTEANIAEARRRRLVTEAGSVHAMVKIIEEWKQLQANAALNSVQRIERVPLATPIYAALGAEVVVKSYGYDPRGRRLEIEVEDENGETRVLAYRNISGDSLPANPRDFVAFWETEILGNPLYQYESQFDADIDSAAPRCELCGQFANSSHTCPVTQAPQYYNMYSGRRTRQIIMALTRNSQGEEIATEMSFSLPAANNLRATFAERPVKININEWLSTYDESGNYRNLRLSGDILAFKDSAGELVFNTTGLRCNCEAYAANNTCAHIGYISQAVKSRLIPASRTRRPSSPEERAALATERQALLESTLRTDWSRNEEALAEARKTWNENAEIKYSEDFDSFNSVYTAAVEAKKNNNNNPVIPFERENALGPWAKRGSGQAFGVEIEYEFPATMDSSQRRVAQRLIGEELFAAGLASSQTQLGYGASKRNGFRDTHSQADGTSNWSWERDGSVNGGELVTPAMYDEPETWQKLEKAVEIMTRHGAIASRKAGAHVHVGTAMYNGDAKKYAELARLMTQHEDVMIRLASDPKRGTHRNNGYSSVLADVPVDGFQDVGELRNWQRSRTRVLNFGGVSSTDPRTDHPEFRIFDSTLNAGAIQAQIKLSVAMTHAAARITEKDGGTKRAKEPHGSHATRLKAIGKRNLTGDLLKEDTTTFRSLIDTLFVEKKDKDQIISIFAQTKWSPARR